MQSDQVSESGAETSRALGILLFMPLFFCTNIVFGRAAIAEVEPFTLAFLRWGLCGLILLPFVYPALKRHQTSISELAKPLLVMGFLGMWICGALVYVALKYTTATNGTLIYTSSPVMVILIERMFRGRQIGWREALGIALAISGVLIIICKGRLETLTGLQFNTGDLIFVLTAVSWAIYSAMLKFKRFDHLQTFPLFALMALSGALLLFPFAAVETLWTGNFPSTPFAWLCISGIVLISSLLAFSSFQNGVRVVGASTTSIFMYLLPVYGVTLAVWLLGEQLHAFHIWGILTVLSGVVLATFPASLLKR